MVGAFLLAALLQGAFTAPSDLFREAESLYQEQRYEEAIEIYEGMRAEGIEDATLYYNLGNAYFKVGRLGPAVLNYERALRLAPGDADTRANLRFANELISDTVEPPPLPLVVGWLVALYQRLQPGLLARMLSLSFIAGGLAVSFLLADRWPGLRTPMTVALAVSGAVALVSGSALVAKVHAQRSTVEAVVLTTNAYVRSGPGAGNTRLAEIHEGLKVRVLQSRDEWHQVMLPNGLTGWLERGEVELIREPVPREESS